MLGIKEVQDEALQETIREYALERLRSSGEAELTAEGTGPPNCSFAVILGPQMPCSLPPRRMGPAMASRPTPTNNR
jgi:hypothetical protein